MALLLAYLSIAVIMTTPGVSSRHLTITKTAPNKQKLDASNGISAAMTSLHSGQGPPGLGPVNCSSTRSGSAYCDTGQVGPNVLASTVGWTSITGSSPSSRAGHSMTYDAADGYVILFGGFSTNGAFADTWKFLGGVWTNITTNTRPSARIGASMAFDTVDGYVVLFGGLGGTSSASEFLSDTWTFSHGIWTNVTQISHPSPRALVSMDYDAADGYVVLFGGGSSTFTVFPTIPLRDTWRFLAGSWTNITTSGGPSARFGESIDYDAADGYLVLFGGQNTGTTLQDTWTFSAGSWMNVTSTSYPSSRSLASIVYDVADGYLVLFGGFSVSSGTTSGLGDTWKYVAGSWTNITAAISPPLRWVASIAYDAADGYVSLFGGIKSPEILGDTWKFLGGIWTEIGKSPGPSPRATSAMAYDAVDGYVILFGGLSQSFPSPVFEFFHDTWKFQGGVWTNITLTGGPSPRGAASMAYDVVDGYVVLFGGFNLAAASGGGSSLVLLHDTWKFLSGVWTNITATPSPPPRDNGAITYDAADNYVLLFGGVGFGGGLRDTWKFSSGVWTNVTSSSGPSPRATTIAYDTADGYVVLFGGQTGSTSLGRDTWKYQGGSWTNITTSSGPSSRSGASMAYDTADGYVVLFGGETSISSFQGDTWKFLAGSWTNITSSSGPSSRLEASMAYDTADDYVILFGGVNSISGYSGDTWKFSSSAVPFDYLLSNNGPVSIQAGSSANVVITATLTAGTAQSVTLSCVSSSLPAGITCGSFTFNPVTPTSTGAISGLTVSGESSVTPGSYSFMVTGSPPGATASGATTTVALTVTSSKDSTSTSVPDVSCYTLQGGGTTCTVLVTATVADTANPSNAPSGTVTFTLTAGTTGGSLGSPICTLSTYSGVTSCSGSFTGTTAGSGSVTATYEGDATHSASTSTAATVTVTALSSKDDTSTNIAPVSCNIGLGEIGCTVTVTATVIDTTNPSNVPGSDCYQTGCTVTFTLDAGTTGGNIQHTCLLSSEGSCSQIFSGTTAGSGSITATYGGDMTHIGSTSPSATVTVTISAPVDYSLSNGGLGTVQAGSTGSVSITALLVSGSRQPVTLSCVSTSLPAEASCLFNPQSVTPSLAGATSVLTVYTSPTTPTGSFQVQVMGSPLGATTRPTTFTLTVTATPPQFDYSLSVNPTTASIVAGSSITATVTAILTGGTAQPVTLTLSNSPNPSFCQPSYGVSPCGSFTFSPATVTPSSTEASSILTISTTSIVPPGTYTLTITGSPAGKSSSSVVFTLTITALSVSSVGCGHDLSCSVLSNSTLSKIRFAGNTIHLEATGARGAVGYANVTVPKSAVPHIDTLHVFVDDKKLGSSSVIITSNSTAYFIYFTFTFHSPVTIDIQLTAPENAAPAPILGLDPTLFYGLIGLLAIIIIVVALAAFTVRMRRKSKKSV